MPGRSAAASRSRRKRLGLNAERTPLRTDLFVAAEKKNEQLMLL